MTSYAFPKGGLPSQNENPEGTAVFTESYAVLPAVTHTDIVTSFLPDWERTRVWILARPMSGFAESFAQYAVELAPEGGSANPEPNPDGQAAIFVSKGTARLTIGQDAYDMRQGSFAYIPPGAQWSIWNVEESDCGFHWIRKKYEPATSLLPPEAIVLHEDDVADNSMPGCNGIWSTKRFLDPLDIRHDFHVNIVSFQPGGRIPFAETHVMEHGLYVLEGTGKYLLNKDWVDVGPGDFMWLRAFCPQACIADGDGPFRYLLYKDVNRHVAL
ncbi:MAG: bifunctional allantoicase/(S)-ureidoglycine aminohydrolase [Pseudomonadota bacterium]